MERKNRNVMLVIVLMAVLAVLLMTLYFGYISPNSQNKAVTVIVEIDGATESYKTNTEGGYVLDALYEIQKNNRGFFFFETASGDYGEYITSVNGRVANDDAHEYYALYINGEYASFGVSEQVINSGDEIKLVLEKW